MEEAKRISEDLVFSLDPKKVIVKEGLTRWRKDMGDISALAVSIKNFGQIQPIVITRDYELIVGGRRVAACISGNMTVKAVFKDTIDPIYMRELELEENLQRKSFSPAEEVVAIKELHDLKQKQYGISSSGREGGWTLEDTAKLIGKTKGSVIRDIKLATIVDKFPELKGVTKKEDIKKAADSINKTIQRLDGKKVHEQRVKEATHVRLDQADARELLRSLPDNSVDLLLTDPPYGIDFDKVGASLGGTTGGDLNSAGFKFNDSKDPAMELYAILAAESFRICKPTAMGYIFVGPEHFWQVRTMFYAVGWLPHVKPIIWIKGESGQCNMPDYWPSSCYEMILYVRKPEAKLIRKGAPDWVRYPSVLPSMKIHPTQKPLALLRDLITRSSHPGHTLLDPFCGSGSSLVAGIAEDLIVIGGDILDESYHSALQYTAQAIQAKMENREIEPTASTEAKDGKKKA